MGLAIGITGGLGAGKSVVSRLLRLNGFTVFDCDLEARRLMENDVLLVNHLSEILGAEAYREGKLDRPFVASIIFRDKSVREKVNRIVHQAVRNCFTEICEKHEDVVFVESAILATGGFIPIIDSIWLVEADESIRITRGMQRDRTDRESVEQRIRTQREEFEQLPKSRTYIICNDGETSLLSQVGKLLSRTTHQCVDFFDIIDNEYITIK